MSYIDAPPMGVFSSLTQALESMTADEKAPICSSESVDSATSCDDSEQELQEHSDAVSDEEHDSINSPSSKTCNPHSDGGVACDVSESDERRRELTLRRNSTRSGDELIDGVSVRSRRSNSRNNNSSKQGGSFTSSDAGSYVALRVVGSGSVASPVEDLSSSLSDDRDFASAHERKKTIYPSDLDDAYARTSLAPIFSAIRGSSTKIALQLIEQHHRKVLSQRSKRGKTLLHTAAKHDNLEVIRKLIALGVDLNTRNSAGETALHLLVRGSGLDAAQALLEAGADPNVQDRLSRNTPLHGAIQFGNLHLAKLLLVHGANPELPNSVGQKPSSLFSPIDFAKLEPPSSDLLYIPPMTTSGRRLSEPQIRYHNAYMLKALHSPLPTAPDHRSSASKHNSHSNEEEQPISPRRTPGASSLSLPHAGSGFFLSRTKTGMVIFKVPSPPRSDDYPSSDANSDPVVPTQRRRRAKSFFSRQKRQGRNRTITSVVPE